MFYRIQHSLKVFLLTTLQKRQKLLISPSVLELQ